MTQDPSPPEFDPEKIRAGSRNTHRIAGVITCTGVSLYLLGTALNAYLNLVGSPVVHGRLVMTIPTDTALGLLGVTATVLVAFVASLWTSTQSGEPIEPARARGRRLVLVDVILATGGGAVAVAVAGALDGWGKDFNAAVAMAVVALSVALAYIAADIGEFIKRDQPLSEAVSELARHGEVKRMSNARQCWSIRSRRAGIPSTQHSGWARIRQNLACLAIAAVMQCVALLAWGGGRNLAPDLSLAIACLAGSLILGQLMVHYVSLLFVRRNWLALSLVCSLSLLLIAVDVTLALTVASKLRQEVGMPSSAAVSLAWSTVFVPLLLCVAGLIVAPNAWRKYRPLREIRSGVIRGMSRHIDKLSRTEPEDRSKGRRWLHAGILGRLRTAIRTATGVEPLESSAAS